MAIRSDSALVLLARIVWMMFGLIFAQMGLASGVFDAGLFSAVTLMVMVTTWRPQFSEFCGPAAQRMRMGGGFVPCLKRVSSWRKGRRAGPALANEELLVVDPIILGDLQIGILTQAAGRQRTQLEQGFSALARTIECLAWDAAVGHRWAKLVVDLRNKGKTMPLLDSLVAATALEHKLTIATRNTRHS